MIFLIFLGALVVNLTIYFWRVYSRFSRCGVSYFKPVPLLGNVGSVMFQKCHIAEDAQKLYNAFPNDRFVGRFELTRPVVVIRDLDLTKQITIRDFEHFIDHRNFVDETVDPMFGRSLLSLKGQEWKDMRSVMSPAFTSSKIRAMVPLMIDVNEQMMRMLKKKLAASKTGYIDIDCKDLTTRYANDVIFSCAFGVKVDSHTDTENELYMCAKSTAGFDFRRILVCLGYSSFPSLMKKMNIKFFDGEANDFLRDLFTNTMAERERNNVFRPDMIHLLLEAKKGNPKHEEKSQSEDISFAIVKESFMTKRTENWSWSGTDLVAQAMFFFLAGLDTIASAMSYLLHELAVNPDIQETLVQEIRENDAKHNGIFNYSSINDLKYFDMVISEVLRLWPPAVGIDRICVEDYNLGKPNDKATNDFIIHKGESILVPIWAIHRDPNYFPNPDKFNPERFSDVNRANIKPLTYMPFGVGPRNCIGSRFALCELKVMMYQLLLQLEVSPCEKTKIPAKISADAFSLAIDGGHWVRLRLRS